MEKEQPTVLRRKELAAAVRNHDDFVEAQRLQLILDSLPSSSTHKDLFGLTYSSNGVRTMLWLLHAM